jgi:hypothetical protein
MHIVSARWMSGKGVLRRRDLSNPANGCLASQDLPTFL